MENILNIVNTTLPILLAPGANNILLMNSGSRFGFWKTLPHILGSVLGFLILLASCIWGLSDLISKQPIILLTIKYFGACWLLMLAWGFMANQHNTQSKSEDCNLRPFSFIKSMTFMLSNPGAVTLALIVFSMSVNNSMVTAFFVTSMIGLLVTTLWTLNGQVLAPLFNSDRFGKILMPVLGLIIGFSGVRLVLL